MKRKTKILWGIFITFTIIGVILFSSSYALFTIESINKSVLTIKVGTMDATVKIDGVLTTQIVIPAKTTKQFMVTLENLNKTTGKFLFYYIGTLDSSVTLGYLKATGIDIPPLEDGVILTKDGKKTYSLKVKNDSTTSKTITLGSLGGLETPALSLPSNGHFLEEYADENACFTFDASTGTITDYDSTCPKEVEIPSSINKVTVTTIGEEAFGAKQLTKVTIPNTVTSIENLAFYANNIATVTIPSSVKKIGNRAFYNGNLSSLILQEGLTTIGEDAFSFNSLTTVTIPSSVKDTGNLAFRNNALTSLTLKSGIEAIGRQSFSHNKLTKVVIPSGVTIINNGAFSDNQISSVTIPDSVTIIDGSAFENNQLKSITLPSKLTFIGAAAFYGNSLTSVVIPNTVTTIGIEAFRNNQLTSITIGEKVKKIGRRAFQNNRLTTVTIPSSVETIEGQVFLDNSSLQKIVNKTGCAFNWKYITTDATDTSFVTGTIPGTSIVVTSQ